MWEWMEKGGIVMYAIGGVSLLGLMYMIYCLLSLQKSRVLPSALIRIVEDDSFDPQDAETLCRKNGGAFAEVLLTVLLTRTAGRDEAEALVEGAGRRAAHELSRGTIVLEVVAAISPLLGLLGTVTGMYNVFGRLAEVGVREAGQLSGGISEALVTTIAGLVVAIPAYVAFTWFSRKVDDLVLEMERYAVALMLKVRD